MTRCEKARSQMTALLSDEPRAEEHLALEGHIVECPDCAAEFHAMRRAWQALDAAPQITPPADLRDSVLSAVAAAREREAQMRSSWTSAIKFLVPGVLAAVASVALIVVPDPDCRTPLAVACCGTLWAGVYALAFAVLFGSQRKSPSRALVGRSLAAAAGGLLLVRFCPPEGGNGGFLTIPFLAELAGRATESPALAFALGLGLAAVPLAIAMLVISPRSRRPSVNAELATASIYFSLIAPALYLASSFMALAGLVALLGGAALGALAPALLEIPLRRQLAGEA